MEKVSRNLVDKYGLSTGFERIKSLQIGKRDVHFHITGLNMSKTRSTYHLNRKG